MCDIVTSIYWVVSLLPPSLALCGRSVFAGFWCHISIHITFLRWWDVVFLKGCWLGGRKRNVSRIGFVRLIENWSEIDNWAWEKCATRCRWWVSQLTTGQSNDVVKWMIRACAKRATSGCPLDRRLWKWCECHGSCAFVWKAACIYNYNLILCI